MEPGAQALDVLAGQAALPAKDVRHNGLAAQIRRGERYAPQLEMRRLATREVKAAGIDYILTDTEGQGMNLIGPHLAKDPASWGLSLVGEYGPMRLYEINE